MTTLRVRVVNDATGAPVGNALVVAFFPSGDSEATGPIGADRADRAETRRATSDRWIGPAEAKTDADGTCVLEGSFESADSAYEVRVVARGFFEWRSSPDRLLGMRLLGRTRGSRESVDLTVELRPGCTFRGRVSDEDGQPVADASIGLVLSGPSGCSWPYSVQFEDACWPPPCLTDHDGLYEWLTFSDRDRVVKDGVWFLTVDHPDCLSTFESNIDRKRTEPDGSIRIDFRLRRGLRLRGMLKDAGGVPVAGARVRAVSEPIEGQPSCVQFARHAESDETGSFELGGLREGPFDLEVTAQGFVPFVGRFRMPPPPTGGAREIVLRREDPTSPDDWRARLRRELDEVQRGGAEEVACYVPHHGLECAQATARQDQIFTIDRMREELSGVFCDFDGSDGRNCRCGIASVSTARMMLLTLRIGSLELSLTPMLLLLLLLALAIVAAIALTLMIAS